MLRAAFFRVKRAGTLLLLALLIAGSMPLAGALGTAPPPEGAAFYIVPGSLPAADAAALRRHLLALHFAGAADEAALREGLRDGRWGCGLLLQGGEATLLHTENAANVPLWQGAAMAALFSVHAPYLTARALEPAGIPADAARARYDALFDREAPFTVEISRVDGLAPADSLPRDRMLMAGAAACLLGAVFAAAMPVCADAVLLRRRISDDSARRRCLAAQLGLRVLLLALATILGAALAGWPGLAPRLTVYLLLCTLLALLALRLTRSPGAVSVGAALLCLLIPVLCPVYVDLGLAVPRLAPVQKLFLPYWLFY